MWIDLVGLGILALFVTIGAARGGLASAAGVISLALGYIAAVLAAKSFGAPVAEQLGLPGLLGAPVAGTAAFAVTFLVCGVITSLLKRWDKRRRGDLPRSGGDRLVGGLFGAVRGSLVVLLLGYMAIWVGAARQLGAGERFAALPETGSSALVGVTQNVVETAVTAAMSDSGGRMAGRMAARPGETLKSLQTLLDDRRIQAVQKDRLFWTYVENGAVQSALNRRSFWRVVNDEQLRASFADLGLIGPAAAADATVFREEAEVVLSQIGPRLKGLDQELEQLAKDPQILAMLESGDTMGLIGHPAIQNLVARVSEGP